MENPPFWWYLPGKMGIFMGYVSLPEGKQRCNKWINPNFSAGILPQKWKGTLNSKQNPERWWLFFSRKPHSFRHALTNIVWGWFPLQVEVTEELRDIVQQLFDMTTQSEPFSFKNRGEGWWVLSVVAWVLVQENLPGNSKRKVAQFW